jgi:soluble lytic murein transglycosylase-like protein
MPISSMACKGVAIALVVACMGAGAAHAANCWTQVGSEYRIDPLLLYSIAKVESALDPKAFNRNRDGSYDIGLMQINSTHLPGLMASGVTRERLMYEPCSSIHAGAQILAGFIDRFGYNWEAVGAYNAGSASDREPLRKAYAAKVWREYRKLTLLRAQRRCPRATAGE